MFQRALTLAAAVVPLLPAGADAQVAWHSPFHLGPGLGGGLGIHLVDQDPGDRMGAMVSWRRGSVPGSTGVRVGIAEGFGDDLSGFGGVDLSGLLRSREEEFPLDLMWAGGLGASIGDHAQVSLPLGLYVGRSFPDQGVRITPYAGGRLSFEGHLGRDAASGTADELDVAVSLDLGGEILLSQGLGVRVGASVGDQDALSVGAVFPVVR